MSEAAKAPHRRPRCTARQYEWRLYQVKKRLWRAQSSAEVVRWAVGKLGVSRRMAQLYVQRARLPRPGLDLISQTLRFLQEQLEREIATAPARSEPTDKRRLIPAGPRVRRLRKCCAAHAPDSPQVARPAGPATKPRAVKSTE